MREQATVKQGITYEPVPFAEAEPALREIILARYQSGDDQEENGLWIKSDAALEWLRAFTPPDAPPKAKQHALCDLIAESGSPKHNAPTLLRYAETAQAFPPEERPVVQGLTHRHFVTAWVYGKESCRVWLQALLAWRDEHDRMLSVREFEDLIHDRPLGSGRKRTVLQLDGELRFGDDGDVYVGGQRLVNALADAGLRDGDVVGTAWTTPYADEGTVVPCATS